MIRYLFVGGYRRNPIKMKNADSPYTTTLTFFQQKIHLHTILISKIWRVARYKSAKARQSSPLPFKKEIHEIKLPFFRVVLNELQGQKLRG